MFRQYVEVNRSTNTCCIDKGRRKPYARKHVLPHHLDKHKMPTSNGGQRMPRYVHCLWQQKRHHSLVTICQQFDNIVQLYLLYSVCRPVCTEQVDASGWMLS